MMTHEDELSALRSQLLRVTATLAYLEPVAARRVAAELRRRATDDGFSGPAAYAAAADVLDQEIEERRSRRRKYRELAAGRQALIRARRLLRSVTRGRANDLLAERAR